MKVILLKDVPKIGKKYEVKNVAEGHALNFLIPRGLVETATKSALEKVKTYKTQDEARRKIQEDLLLKNIADLEGVKIEMSETANDKGHLFAGIHKEEIIPEISKQTKLEILPEHLLLDKPIKSVGEHIIEVKIRDTHAKFTLIVSAKTD
jgi:large subunit ribosomal protein L9